MQGSKGGSNVALRIVAAVALVLSLGTAFALPSPIEAQSVVTVKIIQQYSSGISGTATLTEKSENETEVVLNLTGIAPDATYPASIVAGSCTSPGTSARYQLNPVVNGTSTTVLPVALAQLQSARSAINVHLAPDKVQVQLACGDVAMVAAAPAAAPTQVPNTGILPAPGAGGRSTTSTTASTQTTFGIPPAPGSGGLSTTSSTAAMQAASGIPPAPGQGGASTTSSTASTQSTTGIPPAPGQGGLSTTSTTAAKQSTTGIPPAPGQGGASTTSSTAATQATTGIPPAPGQGGMASTSTTAPQPVQMTARTAAPAPTAPTTAPAASPSTRFAGTGPTTGQPSEAPALASPSTLRVPFLAQNSSGIMGLATLMPAESQTEITLNLEGSLPAGPLPVFLARGTCAQFDPSAPIAVLTDATNGTSTTRIDFPLAMLQTSPHVIYVVESIQNSNVVLACSDLQPSSPNQPTR